MSEPLVTFALFAYNQERFIREAVRGALSQTYSPLQILLSDDCSSDGTFEAIKEEVAGYDGPHRVLLNRNEHNLGIGGHVNRLMELADGEFIVAAAGDDISLPTRTTDLVEVWSKGRALSVYSDCTIIDEDGAYMGVGADLAGNKLTLPARESWREKARSGTMRGLGGGHSWDRAVFDVFGPLPEDVVCEDTTIPFRAALLGEVSFLDRRLIRHRRHDTNVWSPREGHLGKELEQFVEHQARIRRTFRKNCESWLCDLRLLASRRPEMAPDLRRAAEDVAAWIEFYRSTESALRNGGPARLPDLLHTIRRVRRLGLEPVVRASLLSLSPVTCCRAQRWLHLKSSAVKQVVKSKLKPSPGRTLPTARNPR
ncbi:MAG: glycosyltransferase [Rubrobacter sp.]|nr:glycosyltransferase [Rubrobacter sp.]